VLNPDTEPQQKTLGALIARVRKEYESSAARLVIKETGHVQSSGGYWLDHRAGLNLGQLIDRYGLDVDAIERRMN